MDHFIATVKDGKLLLTKKGYQVSKEFHEGTSFVNSSVETVSYAPRLNPNSLCSKRFNVRFTKSRQHTGPIERFKTAGNINSDNKPTAKSMARRKAGRSSTATADSLSSPDSIQWIDSFWHLGVPHTITDWAVHQSPVELTAAHRSALQCYFDLITRKSYPFEVSGPLPHNPLQTPEAYREIFKEPLILQCTLSVGAMCEAWRCHTRDFAALDYHYAELCSLVNTILSATTHPSRQAILLLSVALLALYAHFAGRYDQWHVHMNALKYLIQNAGYQVLKTPAVRWLIHKADLNGSIEQAKNAYIPVFRYYPSIYEVLDEGLKEETRRIIESCIGACFSTEIVMETFTDLALFLKALKLVRSRKVLRFNSDAMMEEFYSIGYRLLNVPDADFLDFNDPNTESTTSDLASSYWVTAHVFLKSIESSFRLASLLYAKRGIPLTMEKPLSHPLLVDLLEKHLRIALAGIRNPGEEEYFYPALQQDHNGLGPQSSWRTLVTGLRPALIYLSLIGNLLSNLYQTGELETKHETTVFYELLGEVVGRTPADVDAVPESDLVLFQVYDLSILNGKNFRVRDSMKQILNSS